MSAPSLIARSLLATLILAGSPLSYAQLHSDRPLRIVTTGIGGGTDFVARLVASGLTNSMGRTVIVDNRGSSVIPGEVVSRATPDGHTLLLSTGGIAWVMPLFQKVPYRAIEDFAPVALVGAFPAVMTINASVPASSVKEFVALARAKPGALNYVMTAPGGSAHLAGELFKYMAKVDITAIPYNNTGIANADLISGRVQLFFTASGPVMPHVKTGKLRALAVTSAKPSALLPDLPTVASAVPGYDIEAMYCLFAPAETPVAVINLLNREIRRVLDQPDIAKKFIAAGIEPRSSTPAELGALRKTDMAKMARMIKEAGLKP